MGKLISIILPVYNGENYLAEAIKSCLAQTYANFELIIVNDCSTDQSLKISQSFQKEDKRIQVISNSQNKKLPASLNIGHDAAQGNYVTWTSDDNILKPNFLEELSNAFKSSHCEIAFSNYDILIANGDLKRKHQTGPVSHLLFGNSIGASFMYKKTVFEKLNGYDETLHGIEDFDFWLRASLHFSFFHLEENLYQYRLQPNSITSEIHKQLETLAFHEKTIMVYKKMKDQLGWNNETALFFVDISNSEKFNFFRKNQNIIISDIHKFQKVINENSTSTALQKLDSTLRNVLKTTNTKKTPRTLFWILKNRSGIFFSKDYSKKQTFKLLQKFL